jgi:hypothetical protein
LFAVEVVHGISRIAPQAGLLRAFRDDLRLNRSMNAPL